MMIARAAVSAALLFAAPHARAASAEPELAPLSPAERPAPRREPAAARHRRAEPRPPPPAPIERDEVRERLRRGPPQRPFVTVRSRLWLARSTVDTRYSIQIPRAQINPPAEVFVGETEERAATGSLLINSVEVAPLSWFSGEFEYGRDQATGGYTDRYWLHSPASDTLTKFSNGAVWHNPDHEDDTIFTADHAARREWISASVYFRVAEGRVTGSDEMEVRHALDIAVGGHRFRQDSHFMNLARTLSTGKLYAPAPLGPIPGFDSTYYAIWSGPHLGFREEIEVPLGFSFEGQFLWSPLIEFHADGYNNLDGSLRPSAPNYQDTARGSAVHFRLGAAWTWSVVRVEAGYMRLSFTSHHGNRRYYNVDGTTSDQAVELTTTEASGLYVGGALRF
jgi:hypothetical protein